MVKAQGEQIWVWLDDPSFGLLQRIGSLSRGDRGSVRFAYDTNWLKNLEGINGHVLYFEMPL